jgi:two-component system, cell cycle sensor histidine kinase and response regulator CckA
MSAPTVLLRRPTVLVVDDEQAICEYVSRVLVDDGYQVITAGDGLEALAVLERYPSPLQLIVTDITMPNMSGTDLADHIAEWPAAPPMIFISGTDGHLGLPGPLLKKPFSPEDLTGLVGGVLRELATPSFN